MTVYRSYQESRTFDDKGRLKTISRVYSLPRDSLMAETLQEIDDEKMRVTGIVSDGRGRVTIMAVKNVGEEQEL